VTAIPVSGPMRIAVARRVSDSGVVESDVVRRVGIAVAVAGVVLATRTVQRQPGDLWRVGIARPARLAYVNMT
jgi:hypothetical protein